ncbi:MAG: polymer-forming cytoskeletal protein [Sulfurovaceae bacterium]|nr:polymer-forming cytoskeletal protein [Sulfurovaceae bacterium]MDD5548806.1 polymer-forming cytoskeletal protein [Sulfurovaceae bacterium]
MGIFSKSSTKTTSKPSYNATIISDDCLMVGGITTSSDVVVNGRFEGIVTSKQAITVGEKGELYGDIKCEAIVIGGLVDGVVDANIIHILSTGKVVGQLTYSKITVEENGFFDGKTIVKGNNLQSKYAEIEQKYHNITDTKILDSDMQKKD